MLMKKIITYKKCKCGEYYEDYTSDTLCYDVSFDEFMEGCRDHMKEVNNYRKKWGCYGTYHPFQTVYGFMLNYHGKHYSIREVVCLDD